MAKQEKSAAELYREERKARLAKAAKLNSKKSHGASVSSKTTKAVTAIIAIIVVVAIAFSVINATGILERKKVAVSAGENQVTLAEYSYYYNAAYSEILNAVYSIEQQMPGYGAQFYGYDIYTMPDAQPYSEEIEGVKDPTWADYFDYAAKQQIKYTYSSLDYAAKNNITLDDEDYAEIDKTMDMWIQQAAQASQQSQGTFSLTAYLQSNYGKSMNEKIFREIIEDQTLVQKVRDTKNDEIKAEFTDKDVDKAFNEALATYGAVSFRSYTVKAEKVKEKGEDGQETENVTDATMAKAKADAEAFAAKLTDEESFKKAASEAEKKNKNKDYKKYTSDDSLTLNEHAKSADVTVSDEKANEWLFSKSTAKGATYIAEEEGTGYTVLYMVDPVHEAPDAAVSYDVRHILIKFPEEEAETAETEESAEAEDKKEAEEKKEEKKEAVEPVKFDAKAYKDVVIDIDVEKEITDAASYNKAVEVLTKYLDGKKTEDSFAALAKEFSEDSNAEQGGLYEDVPLGQMVPSFENWSTLLTRKAGDVGIVESNYGYHVMYFVDSEIEKMDEVIKNDLATEDLNKFVEKLGENKDFEAKNVDEKAISEARANIMKIAKSNVDYFSQMQGMSY